MVHNECVCNIRRKRFILQMCIFSISLEPGVIRLFEKCGILSECYKLSPPVLTTGSPKAVHELSCLCDNACKRSLAICRKIRASCPVSRLLSVPIWPACAEQGR